MADNIQDIGIGGGSPEPSTQQQAAGAPSDFSQSTSFGTSEQARSVSGRSRGGEKIHKYVGVARERALKQADSQLGRVNEQLRGVTRRLEGASLEAGPEKKLIEGAVSVLRSVSDRIEGQNAEQLFNELGRQLRQRPVAAIAGVFALGFLGGRVLKGARGESSDIPSFRGTRYEEFGGAQ